MRRQYCPVDPCLRVPGALFVISSILHQLLLEANKHICITETSSETSAEGREEGEKRTYIATEKENVEQKTVEGRKPERGARSRKKEEEEEEGKRRRRRVALPRNVVASPAPQATTLAAPTALRPALHTMHTLHYSAILSCASTCPCYH